MIRRAIKPEKTIIYMRCLKCGKYLRLIQKFCPKCGTAVTAEQKKKALITFGIWVLLFLLFLPVVYYFSTKNPQLQGYSNLYIFSVAAFLSLVAVEIIALIYWIIASIVRFIIRQPIFGSIVVGAIFIVIGFGVYFYMMDVNSKKFSDSIALIQENLNEAAAAKIMGDSIIAQKTIPGSSMIRVKSAAELVANRLEFMSVPKELSDYQQSIIAWSEEIAKAADDTKIWSSVADQPGDFQLKLGQKQSEKLFQDSIKKITELKEFGDDAIKRKDRITMLYIAAKLVTEEHWLNGILHSTNAGFLSFNNLVSPALALSFGEGVPDVGSGVDVTCQVCNDPKIQWTADLRRQYGCDTKCSGSQQQNQQPIQQNQDQQIQNNAGSQSNAGSLNGSGGNGNQTAPRRVCIGRGGTSFGNSATNVYCIEDVIQLINSIDASAINIARGDTNANGWDNGWHNLEGLGIISQTPATNSSERSPAVQAFYDGCQNKGGLVGGAGTVKAGLPTTESGYTCEYKSDTPRNGMQPCWDFLTYSGGRYLGGNTGCPTENLLPKIDDQTLKDKTAELGGKWDGNYALSGTTIKCAGDFVYSIPIPAVVAPVRNNILSSTQGPIPINGNTAVWTMSTSTQQENSVVSVSEIDTFRFYQSGDTTGVSGTYSANITISTDDQVKISTCYGSIGGARQ
jgi:hypothetical protein